MRSGLRTHGNEKAAIASFDEIGSRLLFRTTWNEDPPLVELLEAVDEHRSVVLVENVAADLYHEIRSNADQILVEGGVVQLAERKAVRNHRSPHGIMVRHDVGCVQQALMTETT